MPIYAFRIPVIAFHAGSLQVLTTSSLVRCTPAWTLKKGLGDLESANLSGGTVKFPNSVPPITSNFGMTSVG